MHKKKTLGTFAPKATKNPLPERGVLNVYKFYSTRSIKKISVFQKYD